MKRQESGFALVPALLIVVIIVAVGFIGWKIYDDSHNQKAATATVTTSVITSSSSSTSSTSSTQPKATAVKDDKFVLVVQKDKSIATETSAQIAKTADQKSVLKAIQDHCIQANAKTNFVIVNYGVFDSTSSFVQAGNYVSIKAGCSLYSTKLDQVGSPDSTYLLRKANGQWVYDAASLEAPRCTAVDGKGYPKTVVATCNANDGSTRAPK